MPEYSTDQHSETSHEGAYRGFYSVQSMYPHYLRQNQPAMPGARMVGRPSQRVTRGAQFYQLWGVLEM